MWRLVSLRFGHFSQRRLLCLARCVRGGLTLQHTWSEEYVFGLIIGLSYEKITKIIPVFVIFYGLMQSFGNLRNRSESYATPVRGTCYGLSAAIGKAGAAVGTQAFTPIQQNRGKKWTSIIAAICGVTGILVTYFYWS
ncbi:putative glycerophosphoinositol permease [Lyophyllum shimeji]|uniref:Glycerophosphoinositol permease n=1 Tax=Lyophyllum shimeji TaxID=47721 RepID=A0A9P3UM17_LYOSH|nr:putative glycerophosphoinositol permease [Lyophyllum shimeji]